MAANIEYFIYYTFEKDGKVGQGNCVIDRDEAISSPKHIRGVEAFLKDTNNLDKVILSNFIKLREFEGDLESNE